MNYYISDLHLGHENVIRFDKRPFADCSEMWRTLRANWNRVVNVNDTVYILGDFCWEKASMWPAYLNELRGNKVLLIGNHDLKQYGSDLKAQFADVKDYKEIDDNGRRVILCHYPIPFHKRGYDPNVFMLYGHVHNTREAWMMDRLRDYVRKTREDGEHRTYGNWYNCCCSAPWMDYTPRTLDEIIAGDTAHAEWRADLARSFEDYGGM